MPSFLKLSGRVTPEVRSFFDYLWKEYLATDQWPSARKIYVRAKLHKNDLLKLLAPIDGAFVTEFDNSGEKSYKLGLLGILSTSNGANYRSLLKRCLEHFRDAFFSSEDHKAITSENIAVALKLNPSETSVLARLLEHGFMHCYASRQHGSQAWSCGIPREIENMPREGSLEKYFARSLDELCATPKYIFEESRLKNMGNSGSAFSTLGIHDFPFPIHRAKDDKRYQVFVSSTYDDLVEERRGVMHALLEENCIPAGMELFPAASVEQWKVIQRVIRESDYYVIMVAGRYGSLIPHSKKSYTQREYEFALRCKIPVLGFYHRQPQKIPVELSERTALGKRRLEQFVTKVKSRTCHAWSNPHDLASAVKTAIRSEIRQTPRPGWVRA